jgi:hypothetical protein
MKMNIQPIRIYGIQEVLRGKFIAMSAYIKNTRRSKKKLHLKHLGQKLHVLPHIQIVDLKQMQQYYGAWVTLGRLCKMGSKGRKTKNMNEVDVLMVQE